MMRWFFLPLILFLSVGTSKAYVRQTTPGGASLFRDDTANLQYLVNDQTAAGMTNRDGGTIITAGSNPMAALQAAASRWDDAPDGNLTFAPLTTTNLGVDPDDGMNIIHFADTDTARSAVGGALAIARSLFFADGRIAESDIIFNPVPFGPFSTNQQDETFDLGSVATHEIGHSLSLAHSGVTGATMFARTPDGTDLHAPLKEDDLAFVRDAYGVADVGSRFGVITGTVSLAGAPLSKGGGGTANGVMVSAIDPDTGAVVAALSSFDDGTYRLGLIRPGNYLVGAEPVDGPTETFDYPRENPASFNMNIQDGFFGGNAAPTPVAVAAGGVANADFAVGAGPPVLSIEFIGRSEPNMPGAFMNLGPQALELNPGDALDLVMAGPGLGAPIGDANVRILNSNISIRAGSVLVDPFQTVNGNPLLRATIDVDEDVAGIQLATITVVKGDDAAIYTGGLVIQGTGGPPPVTHEVSGVFDAAGFQALISPGSIVAVGGLFTDQTPPPPTTIPLPFDLDGFSVTFDGVEGALFGVFDGVVFDQANAQMPWNVDVSDGSVDVRVRWTDASGTIESQPFAVPAALASPGIFEFPFGQAIVTNFSLAGDDVIQDSWAQPAGSVPDPNVVTQPAAIGGVITLWGNGLGPVMPAPPPTGAAPGAALFVEKTIRVLVGGVQAVVLGSVLHGGSVGLNQINAIVPDGVTPGDAVPIVIEVDCGDGNVFRSRAGVTIAVRPRP